MTDIKLYLQARRTVTRVEVDGVMMRDAIEAHLKQALPALADGSFCPKGWNYNESHFLDPIFDAFLGECRGNCTSYDRKRQDAEDALGFTSKSPSWRLSVRLTENYLTASPSRAPLSTSSCDVEIPLSLLMDVANLVFGDAQKVRVEWCW